jgi:hypothetical protein
MIDWRKLQYEELHISDSLSVVIRKIKSRRMRWAGHGMEAKSNVCRFCGGKARKKQIIRKT